jgi:outer membrane protein assembly factor BamE (lipoprotein component of BamABCDE complex)
MNRPEAPIMKKSRFQFSVTRIMITLVLIGALLGVVAYPAREIILHFDGTVYSKGYSERLFRQIRVGMTRSEVEKLMGPPLEKNRWGDGKSETWMYTYHDPVTSNYWRRWVQIENGSVVQVLNDYWED